jgi:hypothetical protein
MVENGQTLAQNVQREALELHADPQAQKRAVACDPPTIHYTELPEGLPESPICHEWNLYRQKVGTLIQEGHEGKFVLIKGTSVRGIFASMDEAQAVAARQFPKQSCLIKQVLTREPLIRMSQRFWQCRS